MPKSSTSRMLGLPAIAALVALFSAAACAETTADGEGGRYQFSPKTDGSVLRLDTRTGRVSVSGNPVKMTSHEYRLLAYLMHHAGRVVSRTELVEHLYDQDFDRDSNTIEVFVGRIRKKLDVDIIQTVRGLGYLLTPPPAAG